MIVHHRGIFQDRFDTPFGIGAMICAVGCHHHCPGCFHKDKLIGYLHEESVVDVIAKVKENPFNQGIVLGGYEWTEQYPELIMLIETAMAYGLEVILYTHYTIEDISTKFSELLKYRDMYIKCGEYDESKIDPFYTSYDVPLASTNQKIYRVGYDI